MTAEPLGLGGAVQVVVRADRTRAQPRPPRPPQPRRAGRPEQLLDGHATSRATTATGPSSRVTGRPAWLVRSQRFRVPARPHRWPPAPPRPPGGWPPRRRRRLPRPRAAVRDQHGREDPGHAQRTGSCGGDGVGVGQGPVVLDRLAEQLLLAGQDRGGDAAAEVGHVDRADLVRGRRAAADGQHVGAGDLLAVRPGQDDHGPGRSRTRPRRHGPARSRPPAAGSVAGAPTTMTSCGLGDAVATDVGQPGRGERPAHGQGDVVAVFGRLGGDGPRQGRAELGCRRTCSSFSSSPGSARPGPC